MSAITISSYLLENWQDSTVATLRIYCDSGFTTSDGTYIPKGSPSDSVAYQTLSCTYDSSAKTLTIPSFTLDSTVDGLDITSARYSAFFFDTSGTLVRPFEGYTQIAVPATPTTNTWVSLRIYNQGSPQAPDETYYTRTQVNSLISTQLQGFATDDEITSATGILASRYASFAAAVSACGSTVTTLVVDTAYTMSSSVTVPSTVSLMFVNSGKVTVSSGTLTINGDLQAPLRQIFSASAAAVVFGTTSPVRMVFPQWWGAVADGTTDCTAAINASQASLSSNGGVVMFPPGSYLVSGSGIVLTKSKIILRGTGMFSSTITATTSMSAMVQHTALLENLAFEDLGFNGGGTVTAIISLFRDFTRGQVRISRCRFWQAGTAGVGLSGNVGARIEDCLFHAPANGTMRGINIQFGIRDVEIIRNRFLYLYEGIILDTGSTTSQTEQVAERIFINDNYFDAGWWHLTARASGSGGTVTYSSTVLTDTGASFSGIGSSDTLRVMPVRQTGTGTFTRTRLTDLSATFSTNLVRQGDIVRAGSAFGIVASVQSETILWVEEWLSNSDRQPITMPTTGTSYTVYGIQLGRISSSTSTTITVDRFHDLDGATVTPANSTLYEVLYTHPNYPINIEYSARKITIARNILRRGWSDQISVFGYEVQIIDNQIEDGQDMGITSNGQHNIMSGNRIKHQGAGGIYCSSDDSVIANNVIIDSTWQNSTNVNSLGDIMLDAANRNTVIGNHCERANSSQPQSRFGITSSSTSDGNMLIGNICRGHATTGIQLYQSGVTNTKLKGNTSSVTYASGAAIEILTANSTTPAVVDVHLYTTANTNPTSITNFTGGVESQILRVLVLDANTTFVHGSTIKTRSGSNLAATNGLTYEFSYRSGVWYMLNS